MISATKKVEKKFDALRFKEECQKNLRKKLDSMPADLTDSEKINKIATESKLGQWWASKRNVSPLKSH